MRAVSRREAFQRKMEHAEGTLTRQPFPVFNAQFILGRNGDGIWQFHRNIKSFFAGFDHRLSVARYQNYGHIRLSVTDVEPFAHPNGAGGFIPGKIRKQKACPCGTGLFYGKK